MSATKAEAKRWLDAHVGESIDTCQVAADRLYMWTPGPRILTATSKSTWSLNGSEVRLTVNHHVIEVTDQALTIEWRDEDEHLIHTTTYSVTPEWVRARVVLDEAGNAAIERL